MAGNRTIKKQLPENASGHVAPVSGLYSVEHGRCWEQIWVRRGQRFPPCPSCGDDTSFRLLQELQHVLEDPDFQ
jgi:hypothetical protein